MHEFSLSTFLRLMPNGLLHEYFQTRGIPLSTDLLALGEHTIEPMLHAIERLEPQPRNQMDVDFQDVFVLANQTGCLVIHEQDERRDLGLSSVLNELPNYHARAMWVFLNPFQGGINLFDLCSHITQVDQLTRHRSRRRKNLPCQTPHFGAETLLDMASQLRRFYRPQGRGYHCRIEYSERPNPPRHCYCAFPEDHTTSELAYEGEALQPRQRKPVFELVFLYDDEIGTLDLAGEGVSGDIHVLHEIFCTTALDMTSSPGSNREQCYSLGGLLGAPVFTTDPGDGIARVDVVSLRMHPRGKPGQSLVVTATDLPLRDWLAEAVALERIPLEDWEVTSAKLRVAFLPQDGKLARQVTFTLTTPDASSLKDHPQERLIQRYLRRWNLML